MHHNIPVLPCLSYLCVRCPVSERGLVRRGDSAHRHRGQAWGQMSQQGEEEGRQCCRDPWPAAGQQASWWDRLQQQQVDWPPDHVISICFCTFVSFNTTANHTSEHGFTAYTKHKSQTCSHLTFFLLVYLLYDSVLLNGVAHWQTHSLPNNTIGWKGWIL